MTFRIAEELDAAGCVDGLASGHHGAVGIHFLRDAATLKAATDSATREVERAGYRVGRIVVDANVR